MTMRIGPQGCTAMTRQRSLIGCTLLSALLGVALVAGCGTVKATTGPFTQVGRLETELRRGASTKMDVMRVLGTPNGFGSAVLPTDPRPREVWYYDDIEVTDTNVERGGVIRANVRQQILLVFFEREVFDGFMWFSNAGAATAH